MNAFSNSFANKKYLLSKISAKENKLPSQYLINKAKEIYLNNKKMKQINNDKENRNKNVLTEIGNISLRNNFNTINNENVIKSKKYKINESQKENKRNNYNNNQVLKLQKNTIEFPNIQKKNSSLIPSLKNVLQKNLRTITMNNRNIKSKNNFVKTQKALTINEENKNETLIDYYSNNETMKINSRVEIDNNEKEKNKSADVSPTKILIDKKNINLLKINTNNSMVVDDQDRKRRGVIKCPINNIINNICINKININYHNVYSLIEKNIINKNPQVVEEYLYDIYKNLKLMENNDLPKKNYMKITQKYISEKMRLILLDWLIKVHLKFKLLDETLFLTINIIDRYLSKQTIGKRYLQLLGITAMFIASKYEEIYPPKMKDFILMTNNTYTKKELISLESDILDKIEFNISNPTSLRFLEIFRKMIDLKDIDYNRCRYFIEICLLDYNCCYFSPRLIAATSIFLNYKTNKNNYSKRAENKLLKIIEYNINDINPCLYYLINALKKMNEFGYNYTSLKRKFEKDVFMNVAKENIDINNIFENKS